MPIFGEQFFFLYIFVQVICEYFILIFTKCDFYQIQEMVPILTFHDQKYLPIFKSVRNQKQKHTDFSLSTSNTSFN